MRCHAGGPIAAEGDEEFDRNLIDIEWAFVVSHGESSVTRRPRRQSHAPRKDPFAPETGRAYNVEVPDRKSP